MQGEGRNYVALFFEVSVYGFGFGQLVQQVECRESLNSEA